MSQPDPPLPSSTDARLDEIVMHLRRLDKRDKMRTWGGFARSIIHFIPIIVLLWSVWFAYAHWDDMLKQLTKAAAEQSAAVMQS